MRLIENTHLFEDDIHEYPLGFNDNIIHTNSLLYNPCVIMVPDKGPCLYSPIYDNWLLKGVHILCVEAKDLTSAVLSQYMFMSLVMYKHEEFYYMYKYF